MKVPITLVPETQLNENLGCNLENEYLHNNFIDNGLKMIWLIVLIMTVLIIVFQIVMTFHMTEQLWIVCMIKVRHKLIRRVTYDMDKRCPTRNDFISIKTCHILLIFLIANLLILPQAYVKQLRKCRYIQVKVKRKMSLQAIFLFSFFSPKLILPMDLFFNKNYLPKIKISIYFKMEKNSLFWLWK